MDIIWMWINFLSVLLRLTFPLVTVKDKNQYFMALAR